MKALADQKYRVAFETPLGERPTPSVKADPWSMIVPCRAGAHIYPFAHDTLAVWIEGRHPGLVKELVAAGAKIRTVGTDGTTLTFHVDLFETVAEIARARKRRRKLSPEHKAKLIAAGRPFPKRHESKVAQTGPVCPPTALVDLGAVQG